MRKAIFLLLLLLLCVPVQAANEIRAFEPGATTCFAVVREIDGDVWQVAGQVFESWGSGGRTAADYDIALSNKTAGMFVGNMDTNIGAGQYYILTHFQVGGSPADSDPLVFQEYGDWSGTVWIPSTITAGDVWEEPVADHVAELTFGGELGGLDPNLTLVKFITDRLIVLDTTVADTNDANSFDITAGIDANDVYNWHLIRVTDATDGHAEVRWIELYSSGREVFVDRAFGFTPDTGDEVQIMSTSYAGWLFEMLESLQISKIPVYYSAGPGRKATNIITTPNLINVEDP